MAKCDAPGCDEDHGESWIHCGTCMRADRLALEQLNVVVYDYDGDTGLPSVIRVLCRLHGPVITFRIGPGSLRPGLGVRS